MANRIELKCRNHGGNFWYSYSRGRKPVACTDDNPCTGHPSYIPESQQGYSVSKDTGFRPPDKPVDSIKVVKDNSGKVVGLQAPLPPNRATVMKAREAAVRLESLGWEIKKAASGTQAVITAVRGEELLVMTFDNGQCIKQDYSLWDCEQPPNIIRDPEDEHPMPTTNLPFDTSECPDYEVVRALKGRKVTWWNTISRAEETAIIGDRVTIEHLYTGDGVEHPEDRIFKFVSKGKESNGFRAFRLGALISIA